MFYQGFCNTQFRAGGIEEKRHQAPNLRPIDHNTAFVPMQGTQVDAISKVQHCRQGFQHMSSINSIQATKDPGRRHGRGSRKNSRPENSSKAYSEQNANEDKGCLQYDPYALSIDQGLLLSDLLFQDFLLLDFDLYLICTN